MAVGLSAGEYVEGESEVEVCCERIVLSEDLGEEGVVGITLRAYSSSVLCWLSISFWPNERRSVGT